VLTGPVNIDEGRELGYNGRATQLIKGEMGANQNGSEQEAPKVVAIGGGTGLATLLRGLKDHTPHITAIVTVCDDGGSSGRLRRELGLLPPGDFRNCIAALAEDEALITQLFQYRFGQGEALKGHSFGNLFITALAAVTGSFERAILEASRVLAVQGRILPSTLEDVTLVADLKVENNAASSGLARVKGESAIPKARQPIERLFLQPEGAHAYPEAVRAILDADLIVAGPGSLFTSVLPNLLVRDIRKAVEASAAKRLYVCNIATQPGETDGFDVGQHMNALQHHLGHGLFPFVLANNGKPDPGADLHHSQLVPLHHPPHAGFEVIEADVLDSAIPWRHDSDKLASQILRFYWERQALSDSGEAPVPGTEQKDGLEAIPADIL
jgi:uncharacterized cofD-like protein